MVFNFSYLNANHKRPLQSISYKIDDDDVIVSVGIGDTGTILKFKN
jgi:hypothetical protein